MSASTASRLDEIIDQSARVAAGITGVVAVWGVGTGLVLDPILGGGQHVRPFGTYPGAEFTHVSMMPGAPSITWEGIASVRVTWHIPMRLYVRQADMPTLRATVAPFFGRYLTAYAGAVKLSNTCEWSRIIGFGEPMGDGEWAWMPITLAVDEWLLLDMRA